MNNPEILKRPSKTISLFYQRFRTRKELAKMDDRNLKDIGITKYEQIMECRKPFWKK